MSGTKIKKERLLGRKIISRCFVAFWFAFFFSLLNKEREFVVLFCNIVVVIIVFVVRSFTLQETKAGRFDVAKLPLSTLSFKWNQSLMFMVIMATKKGERKGTEVTQQQRADVPDTGECPSYTAQRNHTVKEKMLTDGSSRRERGKKNRKGEGGVGERRWLAAVNAEAELRVRPYSR